MSDNGHILVVDDQKEICDVVQEYLTGEGYRVSTANDGNGMRRALGDGGARSLSRQRTRAIAIREAPPFRARRGAPEHQGQLISTVGVKI